MAATTLGKNFFLDAPNSRSMITAADVGVGIEGKEGKQASLAADFSLTKFSHVLRLIGTNAPLLF